MRDELRAARPGSERKRRSDSGVERGERNEVRGTMRGKCVYPGFVIGRFQTLFRG